MIKKKIVFISVFVVVLCAVVGFVVYSIISTNSPQKGNNINGNNGNNNTTNEENENANLGYLLELNCKDITIFEGEYFRFNNFIVCNNPSNWEITISSLSTDDIQVDAENCIVLGKNPVYEAEVEIVASPKFDYTKTEYKDIVMPRKKKFKVTVIPKEIDLTYDIEPLGMNEFKVEVRSSNIRLDKMTLQVLNSNEFEINEVTKYAGAVNFKSVKLINAISNNLELYYEIVDVYGKKATKNLNVPISQREDMLEYSFTAPEDFSYRLYVTKNNEYSADYPNSATLTFGKSFELENPNERFVLKSGSSSGLLIDGLTINAREVGTYEIDLVVGDRVVETYPIQVQNVPVSSINVALDPECYVNNTLTLTSNIVEIVAPPLAIYSVDYEILTGNNFSTIENGIFFATQVGEYSVKVTAGNEEKVFNITVKNEPLPYFALVDTLGNEISEINISLAELQLNPEVLINVSYNNPIFSSYGTTVTSESSAILGAEIMVKTQLIIFVNSVAVSVGDTIELFIELNVPDPGHLDIWKININIIN